MKNEVNLLSFMKANKNHQPNQALDRGLELINYLMLYPSGCRYGELKSRFQIGDASLTRLLKSLICLNWLALSKNRTYIPGKRAEALMLDLKTQPEKNELQELVSHVAQRAQQSCAICSLDGNKMIFKASVNIPNSIVTMNPGTTLNPESDHAAALAILSMVDTQVRSKFFKRKKSTLENESHFQQSLKKFRKSKVILDLSRERKGVSRIAIPFVFRQIPSALLLCGLATELRQQFSRLSIILEESVQRDT